MRATIVMLGLVLAACGGESATTEPAPDSSPRSTSTSAPAGLPPGPSALDDVDDPSFPPALVDTSQIISGGPAPDGIPPIDDPRFVDVDTADRTLDDDEAVIVLDIDGDARAYPVRILIWHEIVNDVVGDTPVSITYCPLCNSAVTYRRTVRGVETTFGTSGRLYASALVMYDRATETLWTHFDGRAVAGVLAGERLEPISSPLLAWEEFKSAHPDGRVLSEETGFDREYGRNPYVGYDDPTTEPFLFLGTPDQRAAAKQRVVGVTVDDSSTAFALDLLATGTATARTAEVGATRIVIFWKSGQASALERSGTAEGRDVGSVAVFASDLDGVELTFRADGDRFFDDQTGSEWDMTGRAVAGGLQGSRLTPIPHLDTFWFAWATYRPGTTLVSD